MEYRRLGRSGLVVSEVALGSWLTLGQSVDSERGARCIERAYELGVTFFDTANEYGHGAAEEFLGSVLKRFPRDTYVLATKLFWPMGEKPTQRGLSRKHIVEQCERSLQRLGHDYIDLYQCHRYDRHTPVEETLRAFDDLVRQGKILYVGVSCWSAAALMEAHHVADRRNLVPVISNQPPYNMLQRGIERDVIPTAEALGVSQVVYSPLAQGALSGKYRKGEIPEGSRAAREDNIGKYMRPLLNDENLGIIEQLEPIGAELGMSMSQLALAWCLRLPNVASVIAGATRPEQVEQNVGASGKPIPPEALERIERILNPEGKRHR